MIDRIVESFTKPSMELTAIDKLIQTSTIVGVVIIVLLIIGVITLIKETIEEERKRK